MKWYVLYTRTRCEKKAEKQLLSMGINVYCPTYSTVRFWSDRKKKVDVPVLPSMVLVRLDKKDFNRVFECSAVVRYMFWLGKKAVVKKYEIDILKKYLDEGHEFLNNTGSEINVGDNFNLSLFNDEKGIVKRISNNNIWIYLKSIGYNVKLKLA